MDVLRAMPDGSVRGQRLEGLNMDNALHLDPVWLRQKYEEEGLSTYDLGKIVCRDPKCIYDKLKAFGIPTRPRGFNLSKTAPEHINDNYMLKDGTAPTFLGKHHTKETRSILKEKASKPKPWLRGSRNGMYGMRGEKNPNYKDGNTPERQRIYGLAEWRQVERIVDARDNRTCKRCGTKPTKHHYIHHHHIGSWEKHPELRLNPDNIITLCAKCHSFIHSKHNIKQEYLCDDK